MLLTVILIYLALGLFLNLINPVKQIINTEVWNFRFENLSRVAHGHKPLADYKILLFKIILILGVFLFWPFFLPGIFKKYNSH